MKHKKDLINYELSRSSLQRSLSLNDEDLQRIGYCGYHTVTASTSLSTASVPQNSLRSTSVVRDSALQSILYHTQN
ncbi:unnamed protein product, partial [Acanthocheilonema viteae]